MELARRFKEEVRRTRMLDLASAASFWLFLALVPIAAALGIVAAKVGSQNLALLRSALAPMPAPARALLESEIAELASWRTASVAPTTILVFFWLASSGFHAILDAFDVTLEHERSWVRKRAVALGLCAGLAVVLAAIGVVVGLALRSALVRGAAAFAEGSALRYAIGFVALFSLIAGLYGAGAPRAETNGRAQRVAPGALSATVVATVLGWGYAQWIGHVGIGSAYQAGLATIGVTMTFLWLFVLSLLAGLTLNKLLRPRRRAAREDLRRALQGFWRQLDPKPRNGRRRRRRTSGGT